MNRWFAQRNRNGWQDWQAADRAKRQLYRIRVLLLKRISCDGFNEVSTDGLQ